MLLRIDSAGTVLLVDMRDTARHAHHWAAIDTVSRSLSVDGNQVDGYAEKPQVDTKTTVSLTWNMRGIRDVPRRYQETIVNANNPAKGYTFLIVPYFAASTMR